MTDHQQTGACLDAGPERGELDPIEAFHVQIENGHLVVRVH